MTAMKKGRISKKEEEQIKDLLKTHSVDQIAEELNRDPKSVAQFVKKKFGVDATTEEKASFDLEDRPFWTEIKLQFDEEEQKLFRYHWSRIVSQFRDDVIPTEELQIVDLIKLDLLMNRCLKQNQESIRQISRLQEELEAEKNKSEEVQEVDIIFNLERTIASIRASQESVNKDYRELQAKKSSMMKDMKATREQRVKRLEDSKKSFTTWVAYLMSNPEVTRKYGVEMEKMRLAIYKERDRLGAFHQYQDGQVDQPFLNSETLIREEK